MSHRGNPYKDLPSASYPLQEDDYVQVGQVRNGTGAVRKISLPQIIAYARLQALGSGVFIRRKTAETVITQDMLDDGGCFIPAFQPDPEQVQITCFGGLLQRNNVDYVIEDGIFINWRQLGLELLLEPDSAILISYMG